MRTKEKYYPHPLVFVEITTFPHMYLDFNMADVQTYVFGHNQHVLIVSSFDSEHTADSDTPKAVSFSADIPFLQTVIR